MQHIANEQVAYKREKKMRQDSAETSDFSAPAKTQGQRGASPLRDGT